MKGKTVENMILPAFLTFMTLGGVVIFAVVSRNRTRKRMEDDRAEKSTLAEDAPNSRS